MDTTTIDRDLTAAVHLRTHARQQITAHITTIGQLEMSIDHQTRRIESLLARRSTHQPTHSHP